MAFPCLRHTSLCMVIAFILSLLAQQTEAGFSPSVITCTGGGNGVTEVNELQRVMEEQKIKGRLRDLGFTESEVDERLSLLNADQIHDLSLHIDDVRIGAGWEVIGIIYVAVIGIILIYNLFFSKAKSAAPAS